MPRIAIFDDYQNLALELADWSPVTEKATVTVFNDHLSEAKDIVDKASGIRRRLCDARADAADP